VVGTLATSIPIDEAASVQVRLLDGFRLDVDGHSIEVPASTQRLIAFLALRPHTLQRGYAAGFLWLDVPDQRALANLRSALWRLRQLSRRVVEAHHDTVRLDPAVSVDVLEATAMARRWVAGLVTEEDITSGLSALEFDLLPDWYEDWVASERERFRQLRLHALEAVSERCIALGRLGDALISALAVVFADPLRETGHRALIRVHLAEGNTGEAVREVRRYERLLREELDVGASPRLAQLLARES
jgi:DNA-binding SARP family transcriptional activator